jgi:hypothetical protein
MANMIPISTVTVGSGGVTAINFSNIPQTYTDLKLVVSGRSNVGSSLQYLRVTPNASSSSSSLTFKNLVTEGSATVSSYISTGYGAGGENTMGAAPGNGATAGLFNSTEINFLNYSSANSIKSYSIDTVNPHILWFWTAINALASSTPIVFLSITADAGIAQYSTATLYGIRKY